MKHTIHLIIHYDTSLRNHDFGAKKQIDGRDRGNGKPTVINGSNMRGTRST